MCFGGTGDGTREAGTVIELDLDRLYVSVDDAIFNVDRDDTGLVNRLAKSKGKFNRAVCSIPAATRRNSTCTDAHALAYGPFMRMIETPHAPPTIKLSPSHRP